VSLSILLQIKSDPVSETLCLLVFRNPKENKIQKLSDSECMKLSSPLEAANHSATQEFSNNSWNGKVHYSAHKCLSLISNYSVEARDPV
jgi:hypothetical protein